MNERNSHRRSDRMDLDPPEVGILYLEEAGYIPGTNLAPQPKKLFVDLINRSPEGVGIQTEKKIDPATVFYLRAFNKVEKTWDLFEGETKWILPDLKKDLRHKLGAELKPTQDKNKLYKEVDCPDKKTPLVSDYQFFRKTDLLKSISRNSVCPLLNCITFKHIKAGQRFITQGEPGEDCYIIQKGTCVINVAKDGELIPVARLQDGGIVGEMALITGEPRSAHVDAETDMQLWRLTKAQFDELSEAYPDLRSFLTDLVTQWFETRTVTAERKIAKYILTDIIGKGSYSIVYRGVHQALNMSVAIKMMKHDMAMETDFIKNFRNEAKTIAKFNHENIVKVYDIEERYQTLFIVMEHLEGMSLRNVLQKMLKLSPKQVVNYLLQVCTGLAYAHEHGIVHQDIKPGNIFILPDEKIKILDFGLACPCGSENLLTGTPFYMSPEQIDCLPVDERTDIYGLGITAYEMLTGQRPFPEEGAWAVMDLHIKRDVPNPASLVTDLPDGLCNFILKACARGLTERYQNMTEVIADLKALAKALGLNHGDVISSNRKMATLFLLYSDEHRHILNQEMEEFCSKMQEMGVACKAADFKEI
ncbi:MAG: protein kinase [Deltaproteobacteria bacterium]|nr:protein kinase [Deltaproteobacteria bacterium]